MVLLANPMQQQVRCQATDHVGAQLIDDIPAQAPSRSPKPGISELTILPRLGHGALQRPRMARVQVLHRAHGQRKLAHGQPTPKIA